MPLAPCGSRYPHEGPCCEWEGCPNGRTHHGYCQWHWRKVPVEMRFWTQVDKSGDCWEWTGTRRKGYGRFKLNGNSVSAHRFGYELVRGKIAKGLEVDHLCRNPACVNPDHLEPVTRLVNVQRSVPQRRPAQPRKTYDRVRSRREVLVRLADIWPDGTLTQAEARELILACAERPGSGWWLAPRAAAFATLTPDHERGSARAERMGP